MQLRALYEIPTVEIGERRSWTSPPEFFLRFPPQEHFPLLLNGPAARMERTIWHYAKRGRTEAVRSFLTPEAEVRVDELDDHGVTPLMVCITHATFSLPDTSTYFSTNTRPPPSPSSITKLHSCAPRPIPSQHAALHGQEETVVLLLEHGASTTSQDAESGYSALHRAFLACKLSTAAALVRAGASVHTPLDHEGHSPLELFNRRWGVRAAPMAAAPVGRGRTKAGGGAHPLCGGEV